MAVDIGRVAQGVVDAFASGVFALMVKPARDLTQEEARKLLDYLVDKKEIALYEPIKSDKQAQVKVQTSIGGVDFLQAQGKNMGRFGSINAHKTAYFQPTPAFAIVLYRLALRLRENWGASNIVWGGIGAGSGKHTEDCHMNGSCVDFYGASTRAGVFDVRRDWYYRPVYKSDGKLHAMDKDEDDRWAHDLHTYYRLLVTKDAEEKDLADKTYYNPRARDFFLDVYTFISEQCAFGRFDISPAALRSGAPILAGYTIHPDYPTLLRRPHNDHIHFQLGQAVQKA